MNREMPPEINFTNPLRFRQRHFIYELRRLGKSPWYMPMGREYDPLGQDRRTVEGHVHLTPLEYARQGGVMLRLVPSQVKKLRSLLHPHIRDSESVSVKDIYHIHLYNDGCQPDTVPEYWDYYSEAMWYLMNVRTSADGSFRREFKNTVNRMLAEEWKESRKLAVLAPH